MSEILFEVTKDHLETGLRGIPVGYCITSHVDPKKGLHYRGLPVGEISDWGVERIIHLIVQGKDAEAQELENFKQVLAARATLPQGVIEAIEKFPREAHPMKLFPAALLFLGVFAGTGEYNEDCLNLIAMLPELVARLINHHAGWGKTPESNPSLGYVENFVQMLKSPSVKDKAAFTDLMRLFIVLHMDHGGGNLSCFTGKTVASGDEDLYGSMSAAMCALAGPKHGKANQDCLEFVKYVHDKLGTNASGEDVEALIRERLANKELVYGFGHAVLRVEDPRATVQYAFAKKHYSEYPLVKIALHLRERGTKVLLENEKIQCPYPNVDAVSGTLLSAAGFDNPEYFTVLFGLSRSIGIARQIVYERCEARGKKGTPIVRPKYFYREKAT